VDPIFEEPALRSVRCGSVRHLTLRSASLLKFGSTETQNHYLKSYILKTEWERNFWDVIPACF